MQKEVDTVISECKRLSCTQGLHRQKSYKEEHMVSISCSIGNLVT